MFSNQNNLQVVYINNNNVQSIDVELFRRVTSLKRLFLWENPLNCNCELRPIVKMVLKRKVLNQGRCRYPPLYDGELWDILKGASYCRLPLVYTQYKPAKADATTVVIIIVGVMVLIGCINANYTLSREKNMQLLNQENLTFHRTLNYFSDVINKDGIIQK
ncbi:hypothetical protein L9F63_028243 [Diploptera punctata]|uniref:LRRCT domain-containing protein n=1 Tax=Diploptera punctata TaxID=6984 RepID=A0AAD7ZVN6_DIPPU|nr:hypothetical protein L9F63_028243 [Diploptera punctata]